MLGPSVNGGSSTSSRVLARSSLLRRNDFFREVHFRVLFKRDASRFNGGAWHNEPRFPARDSFPPKSPPLKQGSRTRRFATSPFAERFKLCESAGPGTSSEETLTPGSQAT